MTNEENSSWQNLIDRLNIKYRLVVLDDATLEEKVSFKLSRMNTYMAISILAVFCVLLTVFTIIYTPLKQYIPGYQDVSLRRDLMELNTQSNALNMQVESQARYIDAFRQMFNSETSAELYNEPSESAEIDTSNKDYSKIELDSISENEAKLRQSVEREMTYTLSGSKNEKDKLLKNYFTPPMEGFVSQKFDPDNEHFGLDIGSPIKDAQVMAIADGVVIMSDWTLDTGHVIAIQHSDNLISFYKHNAVTLKKIGNFVKAGDAIAILGNTGELTSGPHLHLELWHNQIPVDPLNYISL